MQTSPRIWTHSVYEAGYHQTVAADYKPYNLNEQSGFHGNSMPFDLRNPMEYAHQPDWSDVNLKTDELSSLKMAANLPKQTTPKTPAPFNQFESRAIKTEVFEEDYFRWPNQHVSYNQMNFNDDFKPEKFKCEADLKNNMLSAQNSYSYRHQEAQNLSTKTRNMLAVTESNMVTSTYQTMTTPGSSTCSPTDSMDFGMMRHMSTLGTPPSPPPSPPFNSQVPNNSAHIPTLVEDDAIKTYATLETPRKSMDSFEDMDTSTDSDLSSWEKVHPMNWTSEEVMDFIYWLVLFTTNDSSIPEIKPERLRNATGMDLMNMTPQDFQQVSPEYGQLFYNKFQTLLLEAEFQYSPNMSVEDDFGYCGNQDPVLSSLADKVIEVENALKNTMRIQGHEYDYDGRDQFGTLYAPDYHNVDPGYISGDSSGGSCYSYQGSDNPQIPDLSPNDYRPPPMNRTIQHTTPQPYEPNKKRGPGRPRKTQADGQPKPPSQRGRKPGQTTKGNHLYEFIIVLLNDKKFNPTLVKWEDRENGVFRFVQSEKIAKMWGEKKNNKNMTYEKLSRAMRFCRTVGYFAALPKDRGFPKKLCFKFGDKAQNWQTSDL